MSAGSRRYYSSQVNLLGTAISYAFMMGAGWREVCPYLMHCGNVAEEYSSC